MVVFKASRLSQSSIFVYCMSKHSNIEIYLADDHEIVAKSIANLLESIDGVIQVKTFGNGKSLFMECNSGIPTLVILDIEMPEWNGLETLKKIRELSLVPVLMLSMNDERTLISECMKSGANGYLNKNCSVKELTEAIETVLSGNTFLSEEIKKILVGLGNPSSSAFELSGPLTDKEYEVLKLVCDGLSSKEIG
jgi:DNA-binding NarL/FixJ family response regulator